MVLYFQLRQLHNSHFFGNSESPEHHRRRKKNVQVLEVAAGKLVVGGDLDLALADLLNLDGVAEVADAAVDLDLVLEELLEGSGVEDLVASGLLSVDDELELRVISMK